MQSNERTHGYVDIFLETRQTQKNTIIVHKKLKYKYLPFKNYVGNYVIYVYE